MILRSSLRSLATTTPAVVVLLVVLGPLLVPTPAVGSPPPASDLRERIDSFLVPLAEAERFSGTVFVAVGDTPIYERSFGWADVEHRVPMTPSTLSGVASITKPMTVIVAARLLETGSLGLGDPVSKWLPDFPRGDDITVEHLIRHQSGLPHRVTTEIEETVPRDAADMVALAAEADLLFEPGSDTEYSSAGYSVLARILELAGDRPYGELLEEHVFAPAGALHSADADFRTVVPRRAESYLLGAEGIENTPLKDLSFLVGAGSVFSTPRDLFAIQRHLLAGGYGKIVRENLVREGAVTWNGMTSGFRAFADYHPDLDLTLIVTANLQNGANDLVRKGLLAISRGDEPETPEIPEVEPAPLAANVSEALEGIYRLREGTELELRVEDPITITIGSWRLVPTANGGLFSPQDWGRIEILRAENGSVEGLRWSTGDDDLILPRTGPLPPE